MAELACPEELGGLGIERFQDETDTPTGVGNKREQPKRDKRADINPFGLMVRIPKATSFSRSRRATDTGSHLNLCLCLNA